MAEKIKKSKDIIKGVAIVDTEVSKATPKPTKTMDDIKSAMKRIEALEVVKASIQKGETAMYTKRNPRIFAEQYIKAYIPEGLTDIIIKFTIGQIDERIFKLQRFITGE